METKIVKITCTAGFSRILEIPIINKLEFIENFPAYDNMHKTGGFLPECTNCNDTRIFLSFNNKNEDTHVKKVCNFTLKNEP